MSSSAPNGSSGASGPTLASLFRERGLTLPSWATSSSSVPSTTASSSGRGNGSSSSTPIKELRDGHRAPGSSVPSRPLPVGPGQKGGAAAAAAALAGPPPSIRALGWSVDGRRLASCATDKVARIWTPERSVDVRASTELRGHTDSIEQLAWDPTNPNCLATASADRTVRFWDIRTASAVKTIATPGPNINIAFHPAGHLAAIGDRDDTLSLIDVSEGRILGQIRNGGAPPAPLNASVAAATAESQGVAPSPAGGGAAWIKSEREEINEFAWSNDGNLFTLATGGGNVRLLDATEHNVALPPAPPATAGGQGGTGEGSGAKGKIVAAGGEEGGGAEAKEEKPTTPIRWPTVHTIVAHTATVFGLKYDPQGRYLATSSADSTVGLWSLPEFFSHSVSGLLSHPARALSFSHDGEFLAAGGEDSFVHVSATMAVPGRSDALTAHRIPVAGAVNCLSWHPSRYYLAFAGDDRDGCIRIFGMP